MFHKNVHCETQTDYMYLIEDNVVLKMMTEACPGFLKGGSNISWFPKKGYQILKGGGGPMV